VYIEQKVRSIGTGCKELGLASASVSIEIHPDNVIKEEVYTLNKAWKSITGLFRHSNMYASWKSEENT
jgi:hypothetical protein